MKKMKKITTIALLICGLTVAPYAQTITTSGPVSLNTEMRVAPDNSLTASTVQSKTTEPYSTVSSKPHNAHTKSMKKWRDRSTTGKILIIAGGAVLVVLIILGIEAGVVTTSVQ